MLCACCSHLWFSVVPFQDLRTKSARYLLYKMVPAKARPASSSSSFHPSPNAPFGYCHITLCGNPRPILSQCSAPCHYDPHVLPGDPCLQHLPLCPELGWWHLSFFLVLRAAPCPFLASLPFHWLSWFLCVIQKNLFVILSFVPITNPCFCSIFHEKV